MRTRFFIVLLWMLSAGSAFGLDCKLINETTLSLSGSIEKEDANCLDGLALASVETVIMNSEGGHVIAAMDIGDRLAPLNPHMIIKRDCNSSCANYWLPLARKITFKRKASIMLHGSMDEGVLKEHKGEIDENYDRTRGYIERQNAYAKVHKIHRGWLFYRTDYALGLSAFEPYLSGSPYLPEPPKGKKVKVRIRYFIVTAPMLQSCLPNIEIEAFDESYAARRTEKQWVKLLTKQDAVSTGTMACVWPELGL